MSTQNVPNVVWDRMRVSFRVRVRVRGSMGV